MVIQKFFYRALLKDKFAKICQMPIYISLLRGINVSGQKKVVMTEPKAFYESLQFKEVTTYIQSGNVIFKNENDLPQQQLEQIIEVAIEKKYGFSVKVIIRSVKDLKNLIEKNPFLKEKNISVDKLHITFLSEITHAGQF